MVESRFREGVGWHFLIPALIIVVSGSGARAEEWEAVTYSPSVNVLAPLSGEGLLWVPVLSPTPARQIAFKFGYSYHGFDEGPEEVDASAYLLVLCGEYTFLDKLTVGAGVPFLVGYDVSTESNLFEESGVDFGNIRVHARYPLIERPENGVILTGAFRLWLPTNTFLTLEERGFRIHVVDNFAVFEPMLLFGLDLDPVSILFETGPKFYAVNDQDDFSFWSFNFVFGAAPIPSLPELEFLLEVNMLVELDEDDAPSVESVDQVFPVALSTGARYRLGDFLVELSFRFGLNEPEFYYGDFNFGLKLGYLLGI